MNWFEENVDLARPVEIFKIRDFFYPNEFCEIQHREKIGSFNYFGIPEAPVIVVPGSARTYFEPSLESRQCFTLQPDSGLRVTDHHLHKMPKNSLDSLFYATDICASITQQNTTFKNIDIVTDRSNLEKLNSVISMVITKWSNPNNFTRRPHKIEIKRIGNVILFFSSVEKLIEDFQDGLNCGLNFKESFTRSSNSITEGPFFHITKFNFGELNIVMRFGVDCVRESVCPTTVPHYAPEALPGTNLKYFQWGDAVSQPNLVELKTMRSTRLSFPGKLWFLLYFSGISDVVMGHLNDNREVEPQQMPTHAVFIKTDKIAKGSHILNKLLKHILKCIKEQDEEKSFYLIWNPSDLEELKLFEAIDGSKCSQVSEYIKNTILAN